MSERSDHDRANRRWIEAIRRAGVVRKYLKIEHPTVADAERAAAEIGIGKRSFYYLVRAFEVRDEVSHAETKVGRISPEAESAIAAAINEVGIDSAVDRIGRLARDIAKAQGVTPPANKTIAARVRAAIDKHQTDKVDDASVVVDHALLEVPVESDGWRAIPTACVVIHQATSRILGFSVNLGPPSPSSTAAAILHAVEANHNFPWDRTRLTFHGQDEQGWRTLQTEIERSGINTLFKAGLSMRYGAATGRLLANQLAKIPLRPRSETAALLARTATSPATSLSELRCYVAEQIRLPEPHPVRDDTIALTAEVIRRVVKGR